MSPAVLITGGTGVVGRALARRLSARGLPIRVLARNPPGKAAANVTYIRGDVRRAEDLRGAIRGCNAVFHCAGEKSNMEAMSAVNVAATKLVFELARDEAVSFFCHLSTVGVIGKIDVPIADESSASNPMNAYEETKLAAERIVSSGFGPGAVAILRPTNVFTSETLRPMLSGSATVTARLLLKGRENTHFVYVEDVAAAAEFCWSRGRRGSLETFIVSSDEEEGGSFLDVQAILAAAWPEARQPPPWSAPTWVPRCLRRIIGRPVNRADLIYSSLRLRTAGFRNPFGRARGLEHAVAALRTV